MSGQYVVTKRINRGNAYLCADLEWRKDTKGLPLMKANTPAELSRALSALHFKSKVLDPGSDPLIDDNTFIVGPSGGLYYPFTGSPVRWQKG